MVRAQQGQAGSAVSSTRREYYGESQYVIVQHCEHEGCDEYLGVNYPSDFCDKHRPVAYMLTGAQVQFIKYMLNEHEDVCKEAASDPHSDMTEEQKQATFKEIEDLKLSLRLTRKG
jgi:hypothetical protein